MPLTSKITIRAEGTLTKAAAFGTDTAPFALSKVFDWASGTAADTADKVWTSAARVLTASSTEDHDLAGPLLDEFGVAITFARVTGLYVAALAGNTNDVVVGGAATNQFLTPFGSATDKIKVKPGGALLLVARDATAYAVTAATADLLRVANGAAGTSVTYDIAILGRSV
jgi:hypothetical protein